MDRHNTARGTGGMIKDTALIKRGRGILKRTTEGKPLMKERAEHRKQELAIEERHA
jgi:hypothetical protein